MRQSHRSVLPETRPPAPSAAQHHAPGPETAPHRSRAGRPVVERIAGWSVRHRKTAVIGWLVLVAVIFVIGGHAGSSQVQAYDPGQSGVAERVLSKLNISGPPPAEAVLIQARAGQPAFRHNRQMRGAAADIVAALHALPNRTASDIQSPLSRGSALVSADGRSAMVTFNVTGSDEDQAVLPALRAVSAAQARHPGLLIAEAGDASEDRVAGSVISHDFRKAEFTSLPVTLVLLVAVFGALIAAGIPLLLAGTAVISAISLTSVIGKWLPVGQSSSEVVLIIGMAVGIDYSLFYLRREREERAKGRSTAEALRIAAATSGRAIVVSGVTVMIALAGLFLTGYSVFTGIGLGSIAVVGAAVVGSLTFLPALLSMLGSWADRGRIPFLGRRTASRPSRLWAGLVRQVVRRPAVWGVIGVAGMIALAAPAVEHAAGQPARRRFSGQRADHQDRQPDPAGVPAVTFARARGGDRPGTGQPGHSQRPHGTGALGLGPRRHPAAGHHRRRRRRPRSGGERAARGQRRELASLTRPCSTCASTSCRPRWARCTASATP